jgi:hypothetical protein
MPNLLLLTYFNDGTEEVLTYSSLREAYENELGRNHEYGWCFQIEYHVDGRPYAINATQDFIEHWIAQERARLAEEWHELRSERQEENSLEVFLEEAQGPVIRKPSKRVLRTGLQPMLEAAE